jgi:hypothetical protein
MFDGIVALVACDKTIPGGAMALLRLNVPGLVLYGGSILPGRHNGHDITIQDVFEAVGANARGKMSDSELLEIENMHGEALMSHLDDFLRHASDGSYDVLAGEENPRFAQRLDQSTVRRVMDLLRRTHDVICVDTGNNVESVNWQTVMRSADQLVITTVPREDAAFTADWMLDVLNETGMEDLVANAVTLISCPSPGKLPLLDDLAKHFATRTRAVAVVPYDPALEVGSSIEYSVLQPETRQAWMRAAAVMIEPFAE